VRVCFVVQRYGAEVAGGAEALCRRTARALAAAGDAVTVHTTTARDYLTWAPHYPEGAEDDDGVRVVRHPVVAPDPERAAALVRALSLAPGDPALEREWVLAQGPVAPGLLAALERERGEHEAFALWTYLYATSQLAAPIVGARAVLVPLAHEEPMLRFALTGALVRSVAGLAFMTPEERALVADLHGPLDGALEVVGTGVDAGTPGDPARARRARPLPRRFALYVGRVDAAKGVEALVRAHARYRVGGGRLGLVLAGRAAGRMRLPAWALTTGFLDDRARADLMAAADVVVLPSRYESLSLAALEAWAAGRPTLANAACEVLAGQTARSGGGLLYTGEESYARQLGRLAGDDALREMLGESGRRFAAAQTWDAAVRRWRGLLARVRGPLAVPSVASS
jgi:glycosyltransferase involved in cell wall biosynthesis